MINASTTWRLDGAETTLLLLHDSGVPRVCWFGERLAPGIPASTLFDLGDVALAFGAGDTINPMSLFPEASLGFPGSPALSAHRAVGGFAHRFALCAAIADDDNGIEFVLDDAVMQLKLHIQLNLDARSDVLTTNVALVNTGDKDFIVDWLASATLPLPVSLQECLTHHGRWGLENQACRRRIGLGRIDVSNLHGRTSHEHVPGIFCGSAGFDEYEGDVMLAMLAWSGNFSLRVERLVDGNGYLQAGVLLLPGEGVLAPGARLDTPQLMLTRGRGINECSQRMHRFARESVLPAWTRTPRPVHANSWEALYFRHDVGELLELVDAAARIGAERFVLDDGWFRNRRSDLAGLGDWYVDETIYPDGLHPIVQRVRERGLQFGLWFEPEMVNPDSDLYRRHPEWALHHAGLETPLARNQLPLDIAREDVQNYLLERIVALVKEYRIDYLKWDMNRGLVLTGDGAICRAARQPPALYRLLDAILAACPGLEIETCASGGARADLGILRFTGRVWASDNIDPIERAMIQRGFLRFLPPEIMGAHVGHKSAHLTGRVTGLHTRAIVALQGQYGFELDARVLDADDRVLLKHYTQLYKNNREWLAEATCWQLPAPHTNLLASGRVCTARDQAWFFVVAVASLPATRAGMLPLRGLDPAATYRMSLASANFSELQPFNRLIPDWCRRPIDVRGDLLMTIGIPLPVMAPQSALLVQCERQGTSQ